MTKNEETKKRKYENKNMMSKIQKYCNSAWMACLCGLLLSGCLELGNEDYIVDWAPVSLYIYVTNEAGESIVEPEMPGLTLTYRGETFEVLPPEWETEFYGKTRAYMPMMYGLVFQKGSYYSKEKDAPNRLMFGELDGGHALDEDIVLTWPDGSTNTIHYHCGNHNERKLKRTIRWELDGKKHYSNEFTFIK